MLILMRRNEKINQCFPELLACGNLSIFSNKSSISAIDKFVKGSNLETMLPILNSLTLSSFSLLR